MVQADIHHQGADLAAIEQHPRTVLRMPADQAEFLLGELAGLVQDRIGYRHLADVVQQSRQPRLVYQRVGQFELAGEGDHQRADRHRMHVGVFIRGLQPYQADQRVGMAQHRGGDFVHQVRCMRGVDGLAHARVVEHADHGGLGAAAEQGGVADFLLQGDPRRRRVGRHGDRQDRSGRDRRFLREVEALAGVDPDLLHGAFAQALQVGLVVEQEAASFPERVVQPRAAKALDEHTEAKLGYRNAFQHDGLDLETGPGGCLLTVAEMGRRE